MKTHPISTRRSNQRGVAIVVFSLLVFTVLIPMVALAIDGGILYLLHAKISAACDAAALAGGRSLNVGLDITSQTASAEATMSSFFGANFPSGTWGTSNPVLTMNVQQTALNTRTATIDATVTAPLYFMGVLGINSTTLAAHGQSSRRDVNLILLLDRSGSMSPNGVCGQMVQQARNFVAQFTEGRDRVGLITFMAGANLDYAPTVNFKTQTPSLDTVLSQLKCGGNTGSAEALSLAHQQIQAINQPGALNLIVFFTDGQPNGVAADFTGLNWNALIPLHTQTDTRYAWNNTGTLVSVGPTTCLPGIATYGVIAQEGGNQPRGNTGGVFSPSSGSISNTHEGTVSGTVGCNFTSNSNMMRLDVAYMPTQDHWGNSTLGYLQPEPVPTGSPYAGYQRVDTPTAISIASTNAADNAATATRNDTVYNPVIYTIGLGGTDPQPIDAVFMERVANDPRSPIYDSTKSAGMFVYASDINQLGIAFRTIASQILRLSQ